jgi:hypothetical protein
MIISEKKDFGKGAVLAASFLVVLGVMFSPVFEGGNAFKAADKLFNSIAKGSSYYMPAVAKEAASFEGTLFEVTIALKAPEMTRHAKTVLARAGAEVTEAAYDLKVRGDLGRLTKTCLEDAEAMFHNQESRVSDRYGIAGKDALVTWWHVLNLTAKDLTRQERFKEAAYLEQVMKKGVEVGYNFFGIEPKKASTKAGILTFALAFYVLYTLWWGYAILYLFHGLGLEMKASAKKEV